MDTGIKIRDIMTKDVTHATVPGSRDDVLTIFKEKQVSGVPVVKGGRLVGIITRKDMLQHPEEDQIALLMTRNPVTIDPDADVSLAASLILEKGIRRLPVVTDDQLLGIVTITDIVRVIADLGIKGKLESVVENGVISIWDNTPLSVAGKIMELAHIGASPAISSEEELSGIVTDKDLINAAVIEDTVEKSDMSAGSDEDAWTWESMRDTMKIYYGVSKIKLPDIPVKDVMKKNPDTVFLRTEISECAHKMVKNNMNTARKQIPSCQLRHLPGIDLVRLPVALTNPLDLIRVHNVQRHTPDRL